MTRNRTNNNRNDKTNFQSGCLYTINIKKINKDLFSEGARYWAEKLSGKKNINAPTQLRRFYDELEMWYTQVFSQQESQREEKLNSLLPYIHMLIAKAAYAKGRQYVDHNFYGLFSELISQIDTAEDLRHAKLFMEALLGFYRLYHKN